MSVDIREDLKIYPMLAELTECLRAVLDEGAPCFVGITVGPDIPVEYVGDDCEGGCGAAYVRVDGAYPTANFPEPSSAATCNNVMAYSISVGILRCVSVGEEDGGPVNQEEFLAANLQMLSDMKAIRQAIQCCFLRSFPRVAHVLGTATPIPAEGGVVGVEWPLTLLENF